LWSCGSSDARRFLPCLFLRLLRLPSLTELDAHVGLTNIQPLMTGLPQLCKLGVTQTPVNDGELPAWWSNLLSALPLCPQLTVLKLPCFGGGLTDERLATVVLPRLRSAVLAVLLC